MPAASHVSSPAVAVRRSRAYPCPAQGRPDVATLAQRTQTRRAEDRPAGIHPRLLHGAHRQLDRAARARHRAHGAGGRPRPGGVSQIPRGDGPRSGGNEAQADRERREFDALYAAPARCCFGTVLSRAGPGPRGSCRSWRPLRRMVTWLTRRGIYAIAGSSTHSTWAPAPCCSTRRAGVRAVSGERRVRCYFPQYGSCPSWRRGRRG